MPEPGDVDRRSGGSWGLRVAVLIGALYWLCLEFVYGGRFEPWIPSSDDFYLFFTPSPVFLSDVLRQPRLVGFAVVNVLNKFGLTATGAGIIVLSLATLALLVATAREILGAAPRWATTAVYLLAVFTNPHYFEAQVFDFYHTI